jgi:hypothetical protein
MFRLDTRGRFLASPSCICHGALTVNSRMAFYYGYSMTRWA